LLLWQAKVSRLAIRLWDRMAFFWRETMNGSFAGFVPIENDTFLAFVTRNGSGTPTDADAVPSYRVYGPGGLMANGTGTASLLNSGAITAASDASPIQITSAAHGLNTGSQVTISGVGGNTAANGTWVVTVVDPNNFTLNGSTGNAAYTSGGSWHVTGLYEISFAAGSANGYAQGVTYTVVVSYAVSSTSYGEVFTFAVV
jgi:hypothetical protein